MSTFGYALAFEDQIADPAVIDELRRLVARLNATLAGIGQTDPESSLQDGNDNNNVTLSFAEITGPFSLSVKNVTLATDTDSIDPGEFNSLRINPTANVTISGIKGGTAGRVMWIFVPDSAAFTLTLADDASSAQADRRMQLFGAASITSVAGQARGWMLQYDAQDKTWVQIGGTAQTAAGGADDVDTTAVTISNSNSETSVYSYTIPANTLTAGTVLRAFHVGSFVKNGVASANFSLKVNFGSTTIASGTLQTGIGQSTQVKPLLAEVYVMAVGASSQDVLVRSTLGNTAAAGAWHSVSNTSMGSNNAAAEDSTGTITLDFLVTISVADAANVYTGHGGMVLID